MTKKDFELIANTLKQAKNMIYDYNLYHDLCLAFADSLENESKPFKSLLNGKLIGFDRQKFLKACDIQ